MSNKPHAQAIGRLKFIFALFLVLVICIVARVFQLQVVQHEHLKKLADKQHLRSVHISAKRGNVYDRNGQNLAISIEVPSIAADPSMVSLKSPQMIISFPEIFLLADIMKSLEVNFVVKSIAFTTSVIQE